jgi:hypothetical protein
LQIASRPIVIILLCLLVPLLLYLYLPIRGHIGSLDGTYTNTWGGFWSWVTASSYNLFFGDNPLARDLDAAFYFDLFWKQFGPVGLALAVVGLVSLVRRPKVFILVGLTFASYTTFALLYRVPDVEVFFLPAFLVAAILIGKGLDHAADLLRVRGSSITLRRFLGISTLALFVAAIAQPLAIGVGNHPDLDLSRQWIVHDFGTYLLEQPLPPESTVVGLGGEINLLRTLQETAGLGTSLETVIADDESTRRMVVDAALDQGRSVFLTRSLEGLTEDFSLDAVVGQIDVGGFQETLIQVTKPESSVPDLPRPTALEPIPGLRLLGYGILEHHGHWQAWARLRLWWRAPQGLQEPIKVSARLLDQAGQQIGATDAEPVSGTYPTTAWRPGEVVADAYEIPLPAGLPPGEYRPLLILYEPETGAERGRVELAPVYLAGNPVRPPRRALEDSVGDTIYARLGDVELLGFTPPDPEIPYQAGDSLPLTLLWQARGEPNGDYQLAIRLEAEGEHVLWQGAVGGAHASSQWQAAQVVRQWPVLRAPQQVPPGTYRLRMRVSLDGRPVPWGRWLLPMGSDLDLGIVQVGN